MESSDLVITGAVELSLWLTPWHGMLVCLHLLSHTPLDRFPCTFVTPSILFCVHPSCILVFLKDCDTFGLLWLALLVHICYTILTALQIQFLPSSFSIWDTQDPFWDDSGIQYATWNSGLLRSLRNDWRSSGNRRSNDLWERKSHTSPTESKLCFVC